MKAKLLFTSFLFAVNFSFAQVSADLDINNVKARINPGGDLFWDFQTARFEVPKGSGINSIFAANLWIGGMDNQNQLHVAAQTYRQAGTDFYPGPLDTLNVDILSSVSNSAQWNRVWKINKSTIDSFKLGLFQTIPQSIMNWPGNGDPQYNQNNYLAPYFNAGGTWKYEPASGDYPIIKGDQAIYFIYNDHMQGVNHTESKTSLPLGVEIHGMAYAFKCSGDSALDNTIFIHYKIINRSFFQWQNCYAGMWCDFDIGDYSDDYVGCDVTRQCFYGYNGDATDGTGGPGTYGTKLGAQSVVFLHGLESDSADGVDNNKNCMIDEPGETSLMSKFLYYNNDGSVIGNPDTAYHYYNYLRELWKDNTPMSYGGNGHNSGQPCNYMFPGLSDQQYGWGLGGTCAPFNPVSSAPWDEGSSNNAPGDRRGLGSSGPFTMVPGGVYTLDLAYVFGRDYTASGVQQSLNVMNTRIDSIRSYFNNNSTPCGQIFNTGIAQQQHHEDIFTLYPNPSSDVINIHYTGNAKNIPVTIFDITGKEIMKLNSSQLKNSIDISSLPAGLYLIRVSDGERVSTKKFVKE